MESLLQLIKIDPAMLMKVLPIVVLIMGLLSACALALKAVAKYTKTDADDKAASLVEKIIAGAQKVVDVLMGNIKH